MDIRKNILVSLSIIWFASSTSVAVCNDVWKNIKDGIQNTARSGIRIAKTGFHKMESYTEWAGLSLVFATRLSVVGPKLESKYQECGSAETKACKAIRSKYGMLNPVGTLLMEYKHADPSSSDTEKLRAFLAAGLDWLEEPVKA